MSAAFPLLLLLLHGTISVSHGESLAKEVQVDGGLNDATAVVGKLFLYTVQPSAFTGHVRNYQISDAADGPLPDWLYWDEVRAQLFGVPAQSDIGHVYVQVTAIGGFNRTHTQTATDVFDVHVREETTTTLCGRRLAVSVALLLDANTTQMTAYERVGLIERAAKELHIATDDLRLYSADYERDARQRDLLMAGPGNAPPSANSDGNSILLWPIGCGQTIDSAATKRVETLEKEAASGAIASKLGYPITSWEVSTGKLTARKNRRQLSSRRISPGIGDFFSTESPLTDETTPTLDIDETTPATPATSSIATSAATTTTAETTTSETDSLPDPTTLADPSTLQTTTTEKRTTRQTTWREEATTTELPTSSRRPGENTKPVVTSSLDSFTCKRGIVCRMKIPEKTFNDAEDGDTHHLKLSLHPIDTTATDWIFLDKNHHHMLGLSLETGSWNYRLEARDSSGLMASTVFAVQIFPEEESESEDDFNHYFRVVIDKDKHELLAEPDGLVKLVRKLATSVSADRDASHMTVRSLTEGSTVIEWSNNTLPKDVCALTTIHALESAMVTQNGKIKTDFVRRMGFHYPIKSVETVLVGNCADATTTPMDGDVAVTKGSIVPESPNKKDNTVEAGRAVGDDFLLSTVLPMIIIAVLLVVALVVACCLYRRNRSYKLAASKEAKSEYVSKGLPVVFPEEVGGRDDLATVTTPMLVKEERPPLQPPALDATGDVKRRSPSAAPDQRGMSAVSATTEHENPLYKPPPPIELTTTRSPRPKHTLPHQREPPPYVPP